MAGAVSERAVIMLTPVGDGMRMAQMRDNSQAIERKRAAPPAHCQRVTVTARRYRSNQSGC
jgi:hypothetical protein